MNKKLSIITLTYNNLNETTIPFIKSLYEYTDTKLFELILVDNGSSDGTFEYLKRIETEKDNLTIIYNKENLGYSKGNNQGMKIAKGEFIALLNNDILLSPDWHIPLMEKLDNPETALVSPFAIQSRFVKESNFLSVARKMKSNVQTNYDEVVKCDFSCVMFKNNLINSIGYFDENFTPAYFEDDDFCVRSILAGYKNYISNQSYIYHKTSSTGKKLKEREEIFNRNKEYFFNKHKNNPFIKYWYQCNSEYNFIKPRFEKLKTYKSTSLKYYVDKIFNN